MIALSVLFVMSSFQNAILAIVQQFNTPLPYLLLDATHAGAPLDESQQALNRQSHNHQILLI